MFEEFNTGIQLTDGEIFFLAKELKLVQTVGFNADYESMNKEMKIEFKQNAYELFEKQGAIMMDFSGNSTVNPDYGEIVKSFEFPEICAVVQSTDLENELSCLRKVYLNDGKWTAVDYVDNDMCEIYKFDNVSVANDFIFVDLNIDVSKEEDLSEITFNNIKELQNGSSQFVIFTVYTKCEEHYAFMSLIFSKLRNKGWYVVDSDEKQIKLEPITEQIRL